MSTNQSSKSSTQSTSTSGGIGFVGLLTIVFIVLKLIGKITWSWWWVLSPIWIGWLVILAIIGTMFGAAFIVVLSKK